MGREHTATVPEEDDPYDGAVNHYTSTQRDDYVKTAWERPQFAGLLRRALQFLTAHNPALATLRVTDIGAGSGEGYHILTSVLNATMGRPSLHYRALDKSAPLLGLIRDRVSTRTSPHDNVSLIHADVRNFDLRTVPSDILLSVGGAFSHLTETELARVLTNLSESIERAAKPTVLFIDVLGRYSIEWLPLAQRRRRPYSMSFFVDTQSPPVVDMTFYSSNDLNDVIYNALSTNAIAMVHSIEFCDRSVFVGRHTVTRRYNPSVPPVRRLINELGQSQITPGQLLTDLQLSGGIIDVIDEFMPSTMRDAIWHKSEMWNQALISASGSSIETEHLCHTLRHIDQTGNGLGLGHSLTAIVYLSPRR